MFKTFDAVMVGAMVAAAAVTYQIKHHAEEKLAEVRRIEAEIRLEKDTIDLLKADWALLTQPNRLERLISVYSNELKLEPTTPTQLARSVELPMLRNQLPPDDIAKAISQFEPSASGEADTDKIETGSVDR